jgi:hypothetical protein
MPSKVVFSFRLFFACGAVFIVGGLSVLTGFISLHNPTAGGPDITDLVILSGIIIVILGFFVAARFRIALWLVIILYSLDTIALFFLNFAASQTAIVPYSLFIHIVLLLVMGQGLGGMDKVDMQEAIRQVSQSNYETLSPVATVSYMAQQNGAQGQNENVADQLVRNAANLIQDGGDKEEARRLLGQALMLEPYNAEALYLSHLITETRSRKIDYLERALASAPKHMRAQQALQNLKNSTQNS